MLAEEKGWSVEWLSASFLGFALGSTIKTALLAEVYGTENLGGIRVISSTLVVFGTSLSPALFGFLLDSGYSFTFITSAAGCAILTVIFISTRFTGCYPGVRAACLSGGTLRNIIEGLVGNLCPMIHRSRCLRPGLFPKVD
jgi:lipoprotein signal peptidase